MLYQEETIAAIATGLTNAGIGIIRVSGERAIESVDKIFQARNQKKTVAGTKSYSAVFGTIYDGAEALDEVICLVMRAPNSYTTEDVVEIQSHGGIVILNRILKAVYKTGVRPAEPGEFTKRAFLGGRIDFTQAESVMDMIHAKNELAAKSGISQLKGALSKKIREIRAEILEDVAYIESALDDPENYSLDGFDERLSEKTTEIISSIRILIDSSEEGKMIRDGIKTVILGKPNAGKSSFLNYILGENRAIVTEIAGTTRDTLEEDAYVCGIPLHIVDTAGIHDTEDIVEKIGIEKAKQSALSADLILYIIDGSKDFDEDDEQILPLLEGKKAILLINKSDINQVIDLDEMKQKSSAPMIAISSKTGEGMDTFKETLTEMFFHGNLELNDQVYITNMRHKQALVEAKESLEQVVNSIEMQMPEDFLTIDLMAAYEQLGRILGEELSDDLANEIFSKFCMGK